MCIRDRFCPPPNSIIFVPPRISVTHFSSPRVRLDARDSHCFGVTSVMTGAHKALHSVLRLSPTSHSVAVGLRPDLQDFSRAFGAHCRKISSTRTSWNILKSDWKLALFTASCETFLSLSASAFLIMALYKFFYHIIISYLYQDCTAVDTVLAILSSWLH